jgi:hypothetical protein
VAEQTAWQAVPAMLFVERHEFGLNAMLGVIDFLQNHCAVGRKDAAE